MVRDASGWRTMAITDRTRLGLSRRAPLHEFVSILTAYAVALARAGVDVLQLREHDLADG